MAVTKQEDTRLRSGEDGVAFVEGEYLPIGEARLPLLDWGFTRSDVTYDVVHVWKGSFFRLDDHLDRFQRSCERLRLDPGYERADMRAHGRIYGNGRPGPLTTRIRDLYWSKHEAGWHATPVDYDSP
jgi:branched-subunit amino acid aminotransferase/4-amino-4-deoxychorismate lyase